MARCLGLYEVAIPVRDLARATRFYCEVLGCEPALRDGARSWQFLWVGGRAGVVVLQRRDRPGPPMHVAFRIDPAGLDGALQALAAHGLAVAGPVSHAWMGARSVYFEDPDGHALELVAPTTTAGGA